MADDNVNVVVEITRCTREAATATLAAFGNALDRAIDWLSTHDGQPPPSAAPAPVVDHAVAASLGRYAAPGKHVVSAAPQPAASTSALKRLAPDPPPPPSLLQRHKGFIYASAHVHDVDGRTVIRDGNTPVDIDAGFEVAPGDASDIEVANAHAWGSLSLVFSDGTSTGSALGIAMYPSWKGIASYFCK